MESTADEEILTFIVDYHQDAEAESSIKLLYPDSAISFSSEYAITSSCLNDVSGRLDVGGKQLVAMPTDTWKVQSNVPGRLSVTNRQVAVTFDKATSVSIANDGCKAHSSEPGSDRRRSWLEMRPVIQGAIGFIPSALLLSPLISLLLPRRLSDQG